MKKVPSMKVYSNYIIKLISRYKKHIVGVDYLPEEYTHIDTNSVGEEIIHKIEDCKIVIRFDCNLNKKIRDK
jgi:hypothetical protein